MDVLPGFYTVENASAWVQVDVFIEWLGQAYQKSPQKSPQKAKANIHPHRPVQVPALLLNTSPKEISVGTPAYDPGSIAPSPTCHSPQKRRRTPSVEIIPAQEIIELSDSDNDTENAAFIHSKQQPQRKMSKLDMEDEEVLVIKPPSKRRRATASGKIEGVRITRQLVCKNIITLTEIPFCWSVPRFEENTAYLLDLTMDEREWKDTDGEFSYVNEIFSHRIRILGQEGAVDR